jgi:integrase
VIQVSEYKRKDNLIPSDVAIKNAKPKEKPYRIKDAKGFYLRVNPDGSKWWRLEYAIDGRRNMLSIGVYPAIGLAKAREKYRALQSMIAGGIDPGETRKQARIEKAEALDREQRKANGIPIKGSFEEMTRTWMASTAHTVRDMTRQKKIRRFERHVFPAIGDKDMKEIKSPDIYGLLKPLIARNELETAHRAHSEISAVFAYAIAHGFADYDPAQPVGTQLPPLKVKHRAALTEPKDVAGLLRDIYSYQGTFVVQCALRFSPLVFQRPGEIRQMEWKDVDLAAKEWRYFVTKTEVQHIVPLSSQAIEILQDIRPLTGSGRYVFPSSRGDGRPMSDNTIRTALKTLGYESDVMTAHGFRTTASTLLNEQGWSPDAIERQLCHMPRDAVRAAYNRAQYLDERRKMMQAWADYLDRLKEGATVLSFQSLK